MGIIYLTPFGHISAPLIGHCVGNALVGDRTSLLPCKTVFDSRRFIMHSRYSFINDVGRPERRQPFQPKTRSLDLPMPELPRLNDLVWLSPVSRHQADGILYRDLWNIRVGEQHEQVCCLPLLHLPVFPPSSSRNRQIGTWRVGNHQVPRVGIRQQRIPSIAHDMELAAVCGRENIQGPCVVPFGTKSASHYTGKFTCDQDFQVFSLSSFPFYCV